MIGRVMCRGCMFSGYPHNEDCTEAKSYARAFVYRKFPELLGYCNARNMAAFEQLMLVNKERFEKAAGSSHNHQAWEGGYLNHITEVLNIALWLYRTSPRPLPFTLADALDVLFLHDLEKPWKYGNDPHMKGCDAGCNGRQLQSRGGGWAGYDDERTGPPCQCRCHFFKSKQGRRDFRDQLINEYKIILSKEQENALRYVEGIPDAEYKPGERIMGELAAFCHCCDILSARLWHNKGREGAW